MTLFLDQQHLRHTDPEIVAAAKPILEELNRRMPRARTMHWGHPKAFELGFDDDEHETHEQQHSVHVQTHLDAASTCGDSATLADDLALEFDKLGKLCQKAAAVCRDVARTPLTSSRSSIKVSE